MQAQRYNKISKALGTRSAKQVASRVQKYCIKLAKLGLPVPGRVSIPSSTGTTKVSRGGGVRRGKISKVKSRGGGATPTSTAASAISPAATGASAPSTPSSKSNNNNVSSNIQRAKPAMRTSGAGYNTMVSGGITSTR